MSVRTTTNTKRTLLVMMAFGVALLAAALTRAELDENQHGHPAKKTDPAQVLSPELRQLLVKEMQLIDNGMGESWRRSPITATRSWPLSITPV